MKRLLLVLAMCSASAVFAADSYLYWMIDAADASEYDYTKAQLVSSSSSTWTKGLSSIDSATKNQISDAEDIASGFYSSLGNNPQGMYYFVELVAGEVLAYSDAISYSDAVAAGYITTMSQFDVGSANLWSASSFTAVPEPTSGMMVLFGMAALALRRRRRA